MDGFYSKWDSTFNWPYGDSWIWHLCVYIYIISRLPQQALLKFQFWNGTQISNNKPATTKNDFQLETSTVRCKINVSLYDESRVSTIHVHVIQNNIVLGSNQKAINYTSSEKKKLRWFVIAQIPDVDSTADIGIVEMKRLRQKQCQISQPVSYGVSRWKSSQALPRCAMICWIHKMSSVPFAIAAVIPYRSMLFHVRCS